MPPFLKFVIRRFLVIPVPWVIITIDGVLLHIARLAKSHPRDSQVWQTLGEALACAGRREYAKQSYERAHQLRE